MPRFYFHTENGSLSFRDAEGVELEDGFTARIQAAEVLGELLKESAAEFWTSGLLAVIVESDDGYGFTLKVTAARSGAGC